MSNVNRKHTAWRKQVVRRMADYGTTFLYLAVFFAAFATYRRLILAEHAINYSDYGVSLIQALLLTKIIRLGDRFRFGQGIERRPLIYPTIYKAVVYTIWVAVFKLVEYAIKGVTQGKGIPGSLDDLERSAVYEIIAKCVVVFCAFIPFFAFKELARVLGEGRISELFFHRKVVGVLDRPAVRVLGLRRKGQGTQ